MNDTPIWYESWPEAATTAPKRSRLYSLKPIGVGTPEVESLTGYIVRLAEAHCVTVSALLKHELFPRVRSNGVTDGGPCLWLPRGIGHRLARMINGVGTTAENWVGAAQALTGRCDLRCLALLNWRHVLPNRELFYPLDRWCPACLEDRLSAGQTIYDPLLWKLKPVTSCLLHRRKLRNRCRHCHKEPRVFAKQARPGCCSSCGCWLGASGRDDLRPEEIPNEDEWRWQNWVVKSLGELVAASPHLAPQPGREVVASAIAHFLSERARSSRTDFCREFGVKRGALRKWLLGQHVIQIDLLLKLCFQLGVSPINFLTQTYPVLDASRFSTLSKSGEPDNDEGCRQAKDPKGRWQPKGVNRESLRQEMQAALVSEPPPSLRSVAIKMNLAQRTVLYCESDLYHQIVDRRAAYYAQIRDHIRQALEHGLQETSPPSLKSLAERENFNQSSAWYNFPELSGAIVERYAGYRKGLWIDIRQEMERVLREELPPPTIQELAARLNISTQSLRDHFPELCRDIAARRAEHHQNSVLKRREQLFNEIRETVLRLHNQGIFPSVTLVSANLPNPRNIGSNEQYVAVVLQARRALGWK